MFENSVPMKTIDPNMIVCRSGNRPLRVTAVIVVICVFNVISHGAAVTQVYFDTGPFVLAYPDGSLLSGGSPAFDHDGRVMQLGYHPQGTVNFSDWIPLTGEGSANAAFSQSTIGDSFLNGAGNGTFFDGWLFTAGNPGTGQSFPMEGTPLAVRFFSGMSIAQSGAYQELSNPMWLWKAPQETSNYPIVSMSLEDAGTKMLFNRDLPTDGKIRTDAGILVPEPVSMALLATGVFGLVGTRRHRHV